MSFFSRFKRQPQQCGWVYISGHVARCPEPAERRHKWCTHHEIEAFFARMTGLPYPVTK